MIDNINVLKFTSISKSNSLANTIIIIIIILPYDFSIDRWMAGILNKRKMLIIYIWVQFLFLD